jgi:hypothetical protein
MWVLSGHTSLAYRHAHQIKSDVFMLDIVDGIGMFRLSKAVPALTVGQCR